MPRVHTPAVFWNVRRAMRFPSRSFGFSMPASVRQKMNEWRKRRWLQKEDCMATVENIEGTDERWGEHGADNYADAMMAAMKLGGIDHLFFNSGTEIGFYQESIAKAEQRGWPTPKLLTVPHEAAALNAALGVTMVTGQPAATAVHVDVGLQNFGGAI